MESFTTVILLLGFSFMILLLYVIARNWSGMDTPQDLKLKVFSLGLIAGFFTCIHSSVEGTQVWIIGLLFMVIAIGFLFSANPDFPKNVLDPNWQPENGP